MKSRTWMWSLSVWLFAALAMPVQARVVYTPVNVTLPASGSYLIDLNHDGITDFTFQISHTFYLCNFERFAYRNTLKVQPSPAGGIVGFNWASALQSSVQIDFHQSFYGSDDLMYDVQQSSGGPCRPPHMYGYWIAVQHHYLGLEFQINGQPHYGWAELSTNGTIGVNTLYGFAYETIPIKGILTGQTMDSPDEPDTDSGSAESKVPGMSAPVAVPTSDSRQLQSSRGNGPIGMAAQDNQSQNNKHKHHQYKLVDIGTLGGHYDFFNFSGAQNNLLSSRGEVAGSSDTTMIDPYCFGNPDCFVEHAFQWQDDILTDLGALPGGANSNAFAINARGVIAGLAQNGAIDPLLLSSPPPWGVQVMHAVTWEHGNITDLGTLGGYLSVAQAINDRGRVVGLALNDIPDPVSAFGLYVGTQMRAFLWENGAMQDLGTLGGPDAWAYLLNQRGQVSGIAFTNSVINPTTGVPTTDPFLWDAGNMQDLGTLGGTYGFANGLNARGQVVGQSNLAGDLTFHPFSWTRSEGMKDLGTFGGDNGQANALNDAGEIVGKADFPGSQIHDGFIWNHGVMTDLGTVDGDPCSDANAVNSAGQVVGTSSNCHVALHAFLWENGGPMVDLNTLVAPLQPNVRLDGSDDYINDRGEILSSGVLQNGDVHAFLLIPCDEKHPGECDDYSMIEVATPQTSASKADLPAMMKQGSESPIKPVNQFRNRLMQRYHIPGQPAAPRD